MIKMYSTTEAAKILGYTNDSYIRKLIRIGKIEATKVGKTWVIPQTEINRRQAFINVRDIPLGPPKPSRSVLPEDLSG